MVVSSCTRQEMHCAKYGSIAPVVGGDSSAPLENYWSQSAYKSRLVSPSESVQGSPLRGLSYFRVQDFFGKKHLPDTCVGWFLNQVKEMK